MLIGKKNEFKRTRIDYLGHVILGNGVALDLSKIQAVVEWLTPNNIVSIEVFWG